MKFTKLLSALSAGAVIALAAPASASMIDITDINLTVRTSTYSTNGTETSLQLLDQFNNNGSAVCDVSIDKAEDIGSYQTCGGPRTDIATLISVTVAQSVETIWQFGADWGRGGIVYYPFNTTHVTGDTWWAYDWNNSDVIQFTLGAGSGTFGLLGFEGFNGGGMSLRYSQDGGNSWTIASVPEPSAIALLGLSLLGFGVMRRRAKR